MTTPFTTTGPVEKSVASATLMETMKNYFEYKAVFLCGIPWIMLHGTPEDYQSIMHRIVDLKALFPDLDWWLNGVEKKVFKMKETVRGSPDIEFWQRMVFSVSLFIQRVS